MKSALKFLLIAFALSSCCSAPFMTCDHYMDVGIGTTVEELEACAGKPYEICELENGDLEYTYIEKVQLTPRMIEEREYVIQIHEGIVINKEVVEVDRLWDTHVSDDKVDNFGY